MEKKYLKEILKGEKAILKRHEISLAQRMFEYICKDKERLSLFLPWPPHIKSVDDEITFIEESKDAWDKYSGANYGIFRKTDEEYLGNVGAFNFDWNNESCEIGYWILGDFEGKGYMRDAVQSLENELFLIGFNRIVIMCEQENQRSKTIPASLGYTFEGRLRDFKKANDKHVTLEVHSKLRRERKVEEVATISEKLGKSKATFLVDFKGLNVEEVTTLRKKLQPIDTEMKVVRNTLAKRALKDHPEIEEFLSEQFVGTNALVFSYEDPSASAKALSEFAKDAEELQMKSGVMDGKGLDEAKIKYLATLPGKDELRAKLLAVFSAPMSKFMGQLEAAPSSFVRVLNAYKDTKSE